MDDSLSSESLSNDRSWLSQGITTSKLDGQDRFLGWWHRWTTIGDPPDNASFAKREAARKGRLFSTVGFFFLVVLLVFLPGCLVLSGHMMLTLDCVLILATIGMLLLNRAGYTLVASIGLVLAAEAVLTAVILTTTPFDETSIQLYDLYAIADLLAVSLLAARYVLVFVLANSLFIWLTLRFQLHNAVLAHDLRTQFIPILVSSVGLQIITAGVAYIWIASATRAIQRAERAEMVATLEHMMAEERTSFELARQQLEESIQHLVRTHAESMNGQTIAKIPYPPDAKVLWPLVGVINSLWMRLQRAHHTEHELQQLKQAIAGYAEVLQRATYSAQPVPIYHTRTELDALIMAVNNLQRSRNSGD